MKLRIEFMSLSSNRIVTVDCYPLASGNFNDYVSYRDDKLPNRPAYQVRVKDITGEYNNLFFPVRNFRIKHISIVEDK